MSTITEANEEEAYRNELFCGDFTKVFSTRISCTVCDESLNSTLLDGKFYEHSQLKVLLCRNHYRMSISHLSINSRIIRCIWCGISSEINKGVTCVQCDRIFCKKCIVHNFGTSVYEEAELKSIISVWQCFVCTKQQPFLFLRTICFAVKNCLQIVEGDNGTFSGISIPYDEPNVECIICLRDEVSILGSAENYDFVELRACSHKFHHQCFKDWIKVNKSCPVCRSTNITRFPIAHENGGTSV